MLDLDYDDTLMAAAGHQAEAIIEEVKKKYKGNYIVAVEGNPPLNEDGMFCIHGGRPFVEVLKETCADAKAIISWGACASYGCVQAAKPNPTRATPVHKVISGKPIINVPGCPPIAEVMTGVVTYMLTFDRIPELDRQGRPKMFYGQRLHHVGETLRGTLGQHQAHLTLRGRRLHRLRQAGEVGVLEVLRRTDGRLFLVEHFTHSFAIMR